MPCFASVMMLSLSTMGIPCNGPLIFPLARSSSSFCAILRSSCFGATEIKALICRPLLLCCSIWYRYASTISTLVMSCELSISKSSKADATSGSKSAECEASLEEVVNDIFLILMRSRYPGGSCGSMFGASAALMARNILEVYIGTEAPPAPGSQIILVTTMMLIFVATAVLRRS